MRFRFSRLFQTASVRVGPAYVRVLWGFSMSHWGAYRDGRPYRHLYVRLGTVRLILGWDVR